MHALLGGEGNSEGLRDYLLRRFRSVVSGYGATDVEIGLAAETPVSVALRRLALERREIAEALFGETDRVPMVFQYNPMLHHVETNARGELLFTVCRSATLSPKVRYNVHDEGGVLRDDELRRPARGLRDHAGVAGPGGFGRLVRMPYLFVFGRADSTVSVMGANIYPARRRGRHLRRSVAGRPRTLVPPLAARGAPGRDPAARLDRARARGAGPELTSALAGADRGAPAGDEHRLPRGGRRVPRADGAGGAAVRGRSTGPFEGSGDRIKHRYVGSTAAHGWSESAIERDTRPVR